MMLRESIHLDRRLRGMGIDRTKEFVKEMEEKVRESTGVSAKDEIMKQKEGDTDAAVLAICDQFKSLQIDPKVLHDETKGTITKFLTPEESTRRISKIEGTDDSTLFVFLFLV